MLKALLFFLFFTIVDANELSKSSSPYLLMHKDDPIMWHEYSKDIFQKAKKEQKLLFFSIGYSSCHWCHEMQKNSFFNPKIATMLNQNFVCVKIDKEQHPEIDSYYQGVYEKLYGHRVGWPLSVFLTPNKEILFIGGYIPPTKQYGVEGFDTLLPKILISEKEKKYLHISHKKALPQNKNLQKIQKDLLHDMDDIFGGFGDSPKFLEPTKMQLLFDVALLTQNQELFEHLWMSLDRFCLSGIYDSVDGGWFRYSVEPNWEIPHFEKMLYTQAEMIALMARAYKYTQKRLYKDVIDETIAFLDRTLFDPKTKLYYSAVDADYNHKEGAYYLFSKKELQRALQKVANSKELFEALEELEPNFQSSIHIHLSSNERPKGFKILQKKLQTIRSAKKPPFIDTKVLLSWNAMVVTALFEAGYETRAKELLTKIITLFYDGKKLSHFAFRGKVVKEQRELLEDYAFFIQALLRGYEYSFEKEYLNLAYKLYTNAQRLFFASNCWYHDSIRAYEVVEAVDKYHASAFSVMMENGVVLANFFESLELQAKVQKMMSELAFSSPKLSQVRLMLQNGVISIKANKKDLRKLFFTPFFYPYVLFVSHNNQGYLACKLGQCFLQTEHKSELLKKIAAFLLNKRYTND